MANRFLETNYFKSPFVRSLKGSIKGLYSFIICDCTPSGIWAKDLEIASMYIGFNVSDEEFTENFIDTGKAIDIGGNKYFFPDFIEHQYPKGLQENNAAHKNIIYELQKFNLLDEKNKVNVKKKEAPSKPLYRSQGLGNGNGQGYGNGNGVGNGQGSSEAEEHFSMNGESNFIVPEMQKIWDKFYPNYSKQTNKDFTALREIGDFILDQPKVKKDNRPKNIKILEAWEIICNYSHKHDFFKNYSIKQLNNNIQSVVTSIQNGAKSKQPTGKDVSLESLYDAINQMPD